jgi:hypothetical protein
VASNPLPHSPLRPDLVFMPQTADGCGEVSVELHGRAVAHGVLMPHASYEQDVIVLAWMYEEMRRHC